METATFPGQDPDFLRFGLLPLDGSGGLGGQVIEDAVDAFDLGDDTLGDVVQQLIGDRLNGGGHEIGRAHV